MPSSAAGPEVAGVDGEVDVGLGVLALGGDPLAQLGVVAGEELDLDAGLLGPLLEGRLDAVVAARVHGQRLAVVAAAAGGDTTAPGARQRARTAPAGLGRRFERFIRAANLEDVGRTRSHQVASYGWHQLVGILYSRRRA